MRPIRPQRSRRPQPQAETPASPPQPPQTPAPPERLQKLLASAGLGSRRSIEAWIEAGRISVNGRAARLGDRACRSDRIELDGKPVALAAVRQPHRVLAYHKPEGELVTRRDPGGRATVFESLPPLAGGKWVAVGRLDINSCGLLLFTDSGELANRLMHPRYEIEREYAVRVLGELSADERLRLLQGVGLDDGPARFLRIDGGEPDRQAANRWYRVTLMEGRNREVRRLFESVGRKVSRLIRVRYGPITLPRDLAPGRWRELEPREVARLSPPPRSR